MYKTLIPHILHVEYSFPVPVLNKTLVDSCNFAPVVLPLAGKSL